MMTNQQTVKAKPTTIRGMLEVHKDRMQAVLPPGISADKVGAMVLEMIRADKKLLECTPESAFGAVIKCCQLGLIPGPLLGQAFLVPFRAKNGTTTATLIIGYKGMLNLAHQSRKVLSIEAREVYEDDVFQISYGRKRVFNHEPAGDSEKIKGFYAIAYLKNGGMQFEYMTKKQVDGIRKLSQTGMNVGGIWEKHYVEMGKKTAIRRLFKMLPITIEGGQAVSLDEKAECGVNQGLDDVFEGELGEDVEFISQPEPVKKDSMADRIKLEQKLTLAPLAKKQQEESSSIFIVGSNIKLTTKQHAGVDATIIEVSTDGFTFAVGENILILSKSDIVEMTLEK